MNKTVIFLLGIALGVFLTFGLMPRCPVLVPCPDCPIIECPKQLPCPEVKCPEVECPKCPDCPEIECPKQLPCPDMECPECPKIECPDCPDPIVCPDETNGYIRWYIETDEKDLLYQKHTKE